MNNNQPDDPQLEAAQVSCLLQHNALKAKFLNKPQRRSVSGSDCPSLTPAPEGPPSPIKRSGFGIRTLKRRTALLFMAYSLAVALFVLSFLYYQHSSLAAMRTEHAAKVLELELSISDLRSGLRYLKIDMLGCRTCNSSSSTPASALEGHAGDGAGKSRSVCVQLDYAQHDRALWHGSDSERERLHSDLALLAEHPCYRDDPEHMWRFAAALYYRAALLPTTVAASPGGASNSATRTNQIAILLRANDTINRARELTSNMDPRVLKWCAPANHLCSPLCSSALFKSLLINNLLSTNTYMYSIGVQIRSILYIDQ